MPTNSQPDSTSKPISARLICFCVCVYIFMHIAVHSLTEEQGLDSRSKLKEKATKMGEIYVVSSRGQGHLLPSMELCKRFASRNLNPTLVVPYNLSSSIPSSFPYDVVQIAPSPGTEDLVDHIASRRPSILAAVVDFQVGWVKEVFSNSQIPVVSFFTFGACAASMEWGAWKVDAATLKPGESRPVPGLPAPMALSHSDITTRPPPGAARGPLRPGGPGGPPKPGNVPVWLSLIEGSKGLIFNTCDDLERPFLSYVTQQLGIPVWGIGPLLPDQYWKSSSPGSLVRDREIRTQKPSSSSHAEEEVIQWLDSKPRGSVLYVAFGSEVGPTEEEYPTLGAALEESSPPFVWAIRPGDGYRAEGLAERVGERGLIIRGWAPQLLILSHPSTGGFLSHCGWSSTAEAVGRGVPLLTWPIRGDQIFNAKLVVDHLRIGYPAIRDRSQPAKKEEIAAGIERLMGDGALRERAADIRVRFDHGFPVSSETALDAFKEFLCHQQASA